MKNLVQKTIVAFKQKWKLILGILIIAALLIGYIAKSKADNSVVLEYQNPKKQTLTKTLDASGHVDAKEKVRLRFIAGGKLTYIGAKEGDLVKKWQTIATIDQETLNKQLSQDLNNYMKERWDFESTQDSIKDKSLTTDENRVVDQEQWDLDNTVLTVEIRDIAIKNSRLTSPIEGILTSAPASVAGMQVLGSDYFEVVNPNSLVFRAAVDESDISLVSLGQSATLTLDAFPDIDIATKVHYVSYTSTETSSGTAFVVEFLLDQNNIEPLLRIGMNGDASISLDTKENVLTIPLISIREKEGKSYVDVKNSEGQAVEREIELGLETDEYVEVISGLSESDEIVVPE